jgi:predicted HAD superfamily Cof-like phosphohydrolase
MSKFEDICDFHEKFGLEYEEGPRELEPNLGLFRLGFLIEEVAEYAQSSGYVNVARRLNELHEEIKKQNRWVVGRLEGGRDLEVQFDSLIDLVYVALGTAYLHGVDFDEGWRRVHAANMKKIRAERPGDSKRGSSFDVIKPSGWKAPDLSDLVETQNYPLHYPRNGNEP